MPTGQSGATVKLYLDGVDVTGWPDYIDASGLGGLKGISGYLEPRRRLI
jgi:hypothetical protein